MGFECLQGGRCHNFPWQSVPVLYCPQCKDAFPHIEGEFLVFQFMAIASLSVPVHHQKDSVIILLTPMFEIFIYIDEIPLSILFLH